MNCKYCNAIPANKINAYLGPRYLPEAKENGYFVYNGLDRVNNDLPHTLENCVPCCKFCNFAKNNLT